MPNVSDLKQSKFLTKNDVKQPVLATISGFEQQNVAAEGAPHEEKWVLNFTELEKPLVLNSTNGQIIESYVGSGEFEDWIGKKIVLYFEPNVSFGGRLTGGIRVRAPKNQPAKPAPAPQAPPAPGNGPGNPGDEGDPSVPF